MDFEKIFLGNTQSDQRKFIAKALMHLRPRYNRVIVPCCGQFALVKCALQAGFPSSSFIASDVSFFSSLLGYFYTGRPLSELPFTFLIDEIRTRYDELSDDAHRAAFLLLLIKRRQLRQNIFFEKRYLDAMERSVSKNLNALAAQLNHHREVYDGITYHIEGLRTVTQYNDPETIILMNPPAFAKGYSRMFDLTKIINYRVPCEEWSMSKEYYTLHASLLSLDSLAFLYRYKEARNLPTDEIVFAKEYSEKRYDYWLCTKPAALAGFPSLNLIKRRGFHRAKPIAGMRIFTASDELTPQSRITFQQTTEEHALYYRDLFAHKLGDVKAEMYILTCIDHKVFAVTGYALRKIFTMQEQHIGEVFGFNAPHPLYRNINRLLMMLITCRDFERTMQSLMMRKNRFYIVRGLKTTCLAKYRKVKLNNGILEIYNREKLPNDMYRIQYQTEWHDRTYADCVKIYLEELNGSSQHGD
jgi:hypothetical protein